VQNEIVINAEAGETRVALLEKSQFTELHIERHRDRSVVGNVVKGRVTRVLPGMQAAFVDIGLDKAAFLYVGDYFDNTVDGNGGSRPPARRRGRGNQRAVPRIETVLREDQEVVVQIAKEPIGSKGARIKSHISIPGRHLVLTPLERRVGVSRRIDNDKERKRLREIVERLRPKDLGFIIRTAGDGVREADIEADIKYLSSVWSSIKSKNDSEAAPAVLHEEPGLDLKVIRDFANAETKRVVTDHPEAYERIKGFVDEFCADPKPTIEHYQGPKPLFDHFDLETQIQANLERKVWLKSGGHLVIDQSEALTAIDVNTGRFTGKRNLEETVLKTNLEAVKEVVYQLRFRNLGGLIIIDLIDMETAANREKVYRALQDAIRHDKTRTNILKISELGLVEMTRKRTRENLVQTLCEPCAYCEGRGYVLSRESVAYRILREIRSDLPHISGRRIALTVAPFVAEELLAHNAAQLAALSEEVSREIEVRARPGLHQEQFEVTALDEGAPVELKLRWLRSREEIEQEERAAAEAERREKEARDAEKARKAEERAAERARRDAERAERRAREETAEPTETAEPAHAAEPAQAAEATQAADAAERAEPEAAGATEAGGEAGEGAETAETAGDDAGAAGGSRRGRRGGRRRGRRRGRGDGADEDSEDSEAEAGSAKAASGTEGAESTGAEPTGAEETGTEEEKPEAEEPAGRRRAGSRRPGAPLSLSALDVPPEPFDSFSAFDDDEDDDAPPAPAATAGAAETDSPKGDGADPPSGDPAAAAPEAAEAIDGEPEKRILPGPEMREES